MKLDYWLTDTAAPWQKYQSQLSEIHNKLKNKEDAYTGWTDWPVRMEQSLVPDILATAEEIRSKCTALVVIGIGGSYLGAKACIELLQSPFYNEYYAKQQKS